MKKKFLFLLVVVFIFIFSVGIYAATGKIIDSKTYVPIRGVFEELGFSVEYDNATAMAVISNGTYTIKVPKNKTYFEVNGQTVTPDSSQTIIDGSMYLPLRAIGDSIGAATSWDNINKVAHISYGDKDSYIKCEVLESPNLDSSSTTITTVDNSNVPYFLHYLGTNENGVKCYSLDYEKKLFLINFVENNIKEGNGGILSIGETLKYPHTAVFSDSKVDNGGSFNADVFTLKSEIMQGREYTLTISGYVTAQLPTGIMKQIKYYGNLAFDADNTNGIKNLILLDVMLID